MEIALDKYFETIVIQVALLWVSKCLHKANSSRLFHSALLMNLKEFFESLKSPEYFFHLHKVSFLRKGKVYWQMFLNPMFLDLWSAFDRYTVNPSNFCHPTLWDKSKSYSPEMLQSCISISLSSGCFLLSIFRSVDS